MSTPFWSNEPTILLNKDYIFDLWPSSNMLYEQKLNAITRLIIVLSILGYVLTMSPRILIAGIVTLVLIMILYKMRKQKLTNELMKESFQLQGLEEASSDSGGKRMNDGTTTNPVTMETILKTEFKEGTKRNPFSNVLLTEIMDEPNRKSAPPSFNPDVDEDITKDVKRAVQLMNPGIKNTSKQLYGDLYENFNLDQSNRVFFSTANTKVANDQGAFAKYLYSDLKYSGKESTPEGAIARVQDNYRYTLY
jgi:hypothetical protein